ncbi:uncharacterized WD repeat-containing protein C17D11.16-like isoform X4 [Vicia villosa]|nr:uncharacterized WD repeat-containing protein C17D11.16-like isoform X4 [Vicia villosa]
MSWIPLMVTLTQYLPLRGTKSAGFLMHAVCNLIFLFLLSFNDTCFHILSSIFASASADKLVKIWDMITGKCVTTLDHHLDKVQAVAWGDHAPYLLVSGSSDRTIVVKDMRAPLCTVSQFSVEANVESLICHPHSLLVGLENGMVEGYRAQPLFSIPAHDESVTTVSYNPCRRNILATGSLDGMVKLWDLSNNQPTCVASKNFGVGSIYSISFSEKDRFMLAIGGETGKLQIWDTSKYP